MRARVILALLLFLVVGSAHPQASPYSNSVFPPQIFTATSQTGATIQLNGLVVSSTVGSSFASGVITVTGTSLTTVSFQVLGSGDNGGTFFPLLVAAMATPTATATTTTVTSPGLYQVNLVGLTHLKFKTTGTFTATNATIILSASPNALISRGSTGGGASAFDQLTGAPSSAQVAGAGTLANDITGTAANADHASAADNANAISGVSVIGTPQPRYVPVADNGTTSQWGQLTQDDILPGFSINFSGGSVVEIGATVTNPTFSASYSSTPTSATITNTDGISSPLNLTTPFTSGTVTGSFSKSIANSTTFTLTAVGTSTKSASQTISWQPRTFGGVGAAAATSSVTASGATAVLSNGAILTSPGLGNYASYGPFFPSGQKIYILMIGGSHTFKDAVTGFVFAFNSPTAVVFVNQNGATVPMYLYESTNNLSGTFTVQVIS